MTTINDTSEYIGEEVHTDHTGLLRLALALEDSRAYLDHFRPEIPAKKLAETAFEERWFGNKSMARIKLILNDFRKRYNAYPPAFVVLHRWKPADPNIRKNLCHWHLQLSDPIYRDLSGVFLVQRRERIDAALSRDIVAKWLHERTGNRWAMTTIRRISENLVTSLAEAGLCSPNNRDRKPAYPAVPDVSLAYLLYLLRHMKFNGTLLSNPYLASVGLSDEFLENRLRRLPSLNYKRMSGVHDFGWEYDNIGDWAAHTLSLNMEAQS